MALTDGIIGCWSPSLGVTGNVLRDVSGKNNHGTLQNMDPTTDWVSTSVRGVSGRVLDFDGSNDYIDAKNTMIGRTQPQFACSIWMLVRSNYGIAAQCNWVNGFVWYVLPYLGGTPYGRQSLFIGTGGRADAAIPTTLNVWRHYWFSFDNGVTRAGYDGVQNYSATYGNTPSYVTAWGGAPLDNARITIGGYGSGETLNGQIGEFAWWNRSVTAAEMREVYQQGNGAIGRQLTDYNRRKYFPVYPSKPSKASLINVKPSIPSFENGFAPRDGEADNPNLLRGLVGAWCPSLGVTGNTLRDISGRNNHGTLTNMDPATDWVVSGGQYALDFDGINDTVSHNNLSMTGAFGVSLWFLKRTNGIYNERIFWGNVTDADTYVGNVTLTTINTQSDTTGQQKNYTFSTSLNQWYHFALSRDANNGVRLYLNGIESTSGVQTVTGTYTLNRIGQYADNAGGNAGFMWDGLLDDMTVFNRMLTANEIRQLYQLGRGAIYTLKSQKKIVTSPSRSTPKSRASIIVRPPKPNTDNLLKGIVGCWSPSLGVTGNTLRDVSGRNNHGVLTNMDPATDWVSTSVRGVSGRVLDFDGSNDYTNCGLRLNAALAGPITLSVWGRFRVRNSVAAVISNIAAGGTEGCQLEIGRTVNKLSWLQNGITLDATSTGSITDADWHHVAVTRSGATSNWTITFGIDGVTSTHTTAANPSSNGVLAIGRAGSFEQQYFNGQIGEVTIYQRALPEAEIRDLYRQGNGAIGRALTQQTTRSNFSSKTFPSTWLKVGDEWTEVQPKVATGSQTSIITRPPIEPSYESGYAPRDGEPLYPNLHKGLVGAWCPSLGVTGRTLRDVSGRNNHGTLTNMDPATDWVVSGGKYALDFDGVNDYTTIPMNPIFNMPNVKTISAWMYARAYDGSFQNNDIVNTDNIDTANRTWQWGARDGNNNDTDAALVIFSFGTGGGDRSIGTSNEVLTVNRWHHIAMTTVDGLVTASSVFLYVDGISQATTDNSTGSYIGPNQLTTNNPLNFGRRPGNASLDLHFNGQLDDIRIYNRAVSAPEIRQLYLLGRGGILTLKQPSLKTTSTIWQPSQPRLYTGDWT